MLAHDDIAKLACPRCRAPLRGDGHGFSCAPCGVGFAVNGGIPDLFPWGSGDPAPEWSRWRTKLALLQEWRAQTWDESPRAVALHDIVSDLSGRFFEFLDAPPGASVLEIGCGDGNMRRFLPGRRYWGIDPLHLPAAPGEDAVFLHGVGERLPLVDGSFDVVLLIQTLDHTFEPDAVLSEARRVLRGGGLLGVMQSLHHPPAAPPPATRLRTALSRMRKRITGRRQIDDSDTKTNPLARDAVLALIRAAFRVQGTTDAGRVLFVRAVRDPAAAPP